MKQGQKSDKTHVLFGVVPQTQPFQCCISCTSKFHRRTAPNGHLSGKHDWTEHCCLQEIFWFIPCSMSIHQATSIDRDTPCTISLATALIYSMQGPFFTVTLKRSNTRATARRSFVYRIIARLRTSFSKTFYRSCGLSRPPSAHLNFVSILHDIYPERTLRK